ncbi:hypothetical protein P280DRAFT_513884 [Massarina eburnea CBS 473.64]|uniref:Uncharacterized protein n=1 Tax=Massarina eburnea CBS 473.64 TaxID=1395130 RepID=A0A6A6SDZ1_9PLEO|nr:hypothetical protein P280DRAFT_513884 [Massarina eburnea CBS 473.64]
MRASTLLTAATTAAVASARLVGISTPATLVASQPYTITLLTENYIQSVADVAVAWGYSTPANAYPRSLGSSTSSSYLGPDKSNQVENVTVQATAPADLASLGDKAVLSVSLWSLYGASGGPAVNTWNVTVNVGDKVEGEVTSQEGLSGTA